MYIKKGLVKDLNNINQLIDDSYNGTCFAYDFFLKLKKSNKILKIYDDNNELQGFMPVFESGNERKIKQSTV